MIGPGGDGANGYIGGSTARSGGGGGGGGIATGSILITNTNTIELTIGATSTSLTYNSNSITCYAGNPASDSSTSAPVGGTGGTVIINGFSGVTGTTGSNGLNGINQVLSSTSILGGAKGGSETPIPLPIGSTTLNYSIGGNGGAYNQNNTQSINGGVGTNGGGGGGGGILQQQIQFPFVNVTGAGGAGSNGYAVIYFLSNTTTTIAIDPQTSTIHSIKNTGSNILNYHADNHAFNTSAGGTGTNVTIAGTCTAYKFNTSSDYRIKTNVKNLIDTEYSIEHLKPKLYHNVLLDKSDIGLIAHEVQEYFPFLVNGEKDGKELQSVNYIGLIGLLINEVKELKKRILLLENK